MGKTHLGISKFIEEGNLFVRQRRFSDAIASYQKVLEVEPTNAEALHNTGGVYFMINKVHEAIPFLEQALSLHSHAGYARNLGKAYFKVNRFNDAKEIYKQIVDKNANDEGSADRYALCMYNTGDRIGAASVYSRLASQAPDNLYYKHAFIRSLIETPVNMTGLLRETYLKCLQDDKISCLAAIDAWFVTISTSPEFKSTLENISRANIKECNRLLKSQDIIDVLNNPLLSLGIEQLIHPADIIENTLKNVRRAILETPELLKSIVPFVRGAATQLFLTEYAISETEGETKQVIELLSICNNKQASTLDVHDLLILACYRPLHLVEPVLNNWQSFIESDEINGLIKTAVSDYAKEEALKAVIPAFGDITNSVSIATRNQYEENPCPRWSSANAMPQSKSVLERTEGLEILNAGCGTGHETITAAQTLTTSNFLGVDLSLSSLAYGKRQADEAGLDNVKFMQGDIAEVNKLDKTFDIILCSGVLHHMEDTQKGLNSLASIMKPKGSRMLVALYSKIAREHLFSDIWSHIEQKGYKANDKDIRQFRLDVLESEPDHFLRNTQKFRDFSSLSECRDMLFHVQENLHTLLDIEKLIDNAGLKLMRVLTQPELTQHYLKTFPEDSKALNLKNWHEFEIQNPEAFRNMYYFWLAHKNDNETAETSPAILASNYI
jgi:ubiquinone/menaquinone biosynthesis C-methylase UbiE